MHSTSDAKQVDPDGDVLVARLEEAIARGPSVQEQVSKLERDAVRYPSDPQIPANTFRPTVPRDRSARRGLIGLLLAACIFVAAFALHSSYGDAVRPIIVRWAPPLVPTSSQLLEKPGLSAQPSPASVQAAAAEPIPPQPTPSAQTAPQDIAPTTGRRAGHVRTHSHRHRAHLGLHWAQRLLLYENPRFQLSATSRHLNSI